ncbi:MAG: hypothetical protein MJ237_06125 [bacterium]|nr:hypothetical protein [bacterium]
MIKDLVIKNYGGNQFSIDGHCFYDTELLVYTNSLVDEIKSKFGVIIPLNEDVRAKANYYRGKQVYGNIGHPKRMYINSTWCDKWELLTEQDLQSVKGSITTYGNYTKDEIIELAKAFADYVNNNDVLTIGFIGKITYYDMPYLCNCFSVALEIIRYYKPFVDIKNGVSQFKQMVGHKYRIDTNKLRDEKLVDELYEYGLIW